MIAECLHVPPEAVRYACNRCGVKIGPDGWFLLPADENHAQRKRWHQVLAAQPLNRAEQLRRDLGLRPPRAVPEE